MDFRTLIEYNVLHPGPDGRVYTWVLPQEEVRIGIPHKPIVSRIPNALKKVGEIVQSR